MNLGIGACFVKVIISGFSLAPIMLASYRARIRAAIARGDLPEARFYASVIVGLRICAGEIHVKLPPVHIVSKRLKLEEARNGKTKLQAQKRAA